ncbi:hypothetical protein [Azospirillum doebereinerae]
MQVQFRRPPSRPSPAGRGKGTGALQESSVRSLSRPAGEG